MEFAGLLSVRLKQFSIAVIAQWIPAILTTARMILIFFGSGRNKMVMRYTMRTLMAIGAILVSTAAFAQPPADIADLVGARGSSGEMALEERGYESARSNLWWNGSTGRCVRVRVADGRVSTIDTLQPSDCGKRKAASSKQDIGKAGFTPQPGFDCARANSETEKLICASPAISELDGEMTRLYQLVLRDLNANTQEINNVKASQRGFLKGRDDCRKAEDRKECIRDITAFRIDELKARSSEAKTGSLSDPSAGRFGFECPGLKYSLGVTFVGKIERLAVLSWRDSKVVLWQVPSSPEDYRGTFDRLPVMAHIANGSVALDLPGVEDTKQCTFLQGHAR